MKPDFKIFFIFLALSSCYQGQDADLIIHNARIYSCDDEFRIYEAMAVKDGKILQLGPEREILNGYDCDNLVDAEMKPVYPGFHDAHCHFLGYAKYLHEADLNGCRSFDEVVSRLVEYSRTNSLEWITGRGWDQTLWTNSSFPVNDTLNVLFPNTPVLISRVDGHAALVNQKALEISGFDSTTLIAGGELKRNESGSLTGLLMDNAYDSMMSFIPEINPEQKLSFLQEAEYKLFEQGLTSINDAGISSTDRELFINWYTDGSLQIRDYCMLFPDEDNLRFAVDQGKFEKGNLHIRSFKLLADGAMGSGGACLIEPYSDNPENHGFLLRTEEDIKAIIELAAEIGYQVNTHAIGDSANRTMLNLYAEVIQGIPDHRWKIEHAQLLDPNDFELFQTLKIIPSVQPTHCTSDMRWAEKKLGSKRIQFAYAYKTLLKYAGILALGTDFPVENISPLETFYAAITRQDKSGEPSGGFFPNEALSREEALLGMTRWAAYSNFEEHEKGSLEPGKQADFVILTRDIMEIPVKEVLSTFVEKTYLGGIEVFSAD